MPKVLPAIFSYEDMKSKFAQDNPDEPYTRRADLESGIYALDSWLIRVDDDNKAISTVGFKEHPSHTVVGGMYASSKGREIGGNNRALQIAREPQLNQSKPLVAAFGHRDGDNARWIAKAKQNGWKFPEDNDFQQVSQMLPEKIVNAWNSAYPNGNWAIRSIRGKGDFAKCIFIDDPMPTWFNLLKSNQGRWKEILKLLPTDDYEYDFRVKSDDGEKGGVTRNIGDKAIIFSAHYQGTGGRGKRYDGKDKRDVSRETITPEIENILLSLPPDNYWFYVNPYVNDYAYAMVKVITDPNAVLPKLVHPLTNRRLKLRDIVARKDKDGRNVLYEKVAVLHHLSGSTFDYKKNLIGPDQEPRLNFYYEGIKRGHKGRGASREVKTEETDVDNQKEETKTINDDKYTNEELEQLMKEHLSSVELSLPRTMQLNYLISALENKVINNEMTEEEKEEILAKLPK